MFAVFNLYISGGYDNHVKKMKKILLNEKVQLF
jgi:hypothetical protein